MQQIGNPLTLVNDYQVADFDFQDLPDTNARGQVTNKSSNVVALSTKLELTSGLPPDIKRAGSEYTPQPFDLKPEFDDRLQSPVPPQWPFGDIGSDLMTAEYDFQLNNDVFSVAHRESLQVIFPVIILIPIFLTTRRAQMSPPFQTHFQKETRNRIDGEVISAFSTDSPTNTRDKSHETGE